MKRKILFILSAFVAFLSLSAQTAEPTMTIVTADGTESEETAYEGSAPLKAHFKANPQDVGDYTPLYEWRIRRTTDTSPFLIRYDEDIDYEFTESGAFVIELNISFVHGTDTLEFVMDSPFTVNVSESQLEFPNAFSPNGDGINDIFKAKEGYKSIVSFEAAVFSRWGKKLYEWRDLDGGWDGRSGGHDVPDGAYYLVVKARGADGRNYNIKKVINILRGYTEEGSTGDI
ncbi:MAG: gliding motility-associated C-terminal domain-containing protein [Alloprevotella sp.]